MALRHRPWPGCRRMIGLGNQPREPGGDAAPLSMKCVGRREAPAARAEAEDHRFKAGPRNLELRPKILI